MVQQCYPLMRHSASKRNGNLAVSTAASHMGKLGKLVSINRCLCMSVCQTRDYRNLHNIQRMACNTVCMLPAKSIFITRNSQCCKWNISFTTLFRLTKKIRSVVTDEQMMWLNAPKGKVKYSRMLALSLHLPNDRVSPTSTSHGGWKPHPWNIFDTPNPHPP